MGFLVSTFSTLGTRNEIFRYLPLAIKSADSATLQPLAPIRGLKTRTTHSEKNNVSAFSASLGIFRSDYDYEYEYDF